MPSGKSTKPLPCCKHVREDRTTGLHRQPEVEETGTGHLRGTDTTATAQCLRQPACQFPRWHARSFPGLQCHVGRVITTRGVTGAGDGHRRRNSRRVQAMVSQSVNGGGPHQAREHSRSHSWVSREEVGPICDPVGMPGCTNPHP